MIQTDSSLYRFLVWAAAASALLAVGALVYQYVGGEDEPGELHYRRGNLRLEDKKYDEALQEFTAQLEENPTSALGFLGKGLALMGLGAHQEALEALDTAVAMNPDFAAAWANRGILLDRLGRAKEALRDYKRALELDDTMGEGPDWITRFLRNQYDRPPTLVDRVHYLEGELKKPPAERLLVVPEIDKEQRPYKVEGKL